MISGCGCNHMVACCAAAGGIGRSCNRVHALRVAAPEAGV